MADVAIWESFAEEADEGEDESAGVLGRVEYEEE